MKEKVSTKLFSSSMKLALSCPKVQRVPIASNFVFLENWAIPWHGMTQISKEIKVKNDQHPLCTKCTSRWYCSNGCKHDRDEREISQ